MSSEMKSKVLAMISYGYSLRHPLSREILSSIYDMFPRRWADTVATVQPNW